MRDAKSFSRFLWQIFKLNYIKFQKWIFASDFGRKMLGWQKILLLCVSRTCCSPYGYLWTMSKWNKNTLTGLANFKKTTRHHTHLSLCAKSRKTNDAKSRKWPKTSIWAIFWRFRGQISPNCKFFWKIGFIQIEGHI